MASHAQVIAACEQFAMVSIAKKSTLGIKPSHAGIGLAASDCTLYQLSNDLNQDQNLHVSVLQSVLPPELCGLDIKQIC
jgi:hypothetical protein